MTVVVVVVVVMIRGRLFCRRRSSLALNFLRLSYLLTRALWARITKTTDWSTGPLARSLTLLNCLLAPPYSLRSFVCSLAHSCACRTVNDWMAINSEFFSILAHSVWRSTPNYAVSRFFLSASVIHLLQTILNLHPIHRIYHSGTLRQLVLLSLMLSLLLSLHLFPDSVNISGKHPL